MNYTEAALRFRLEALSYPFLSSLDLSDSLHLQKLICYLEDTHIRRLPPASRAPLRRTPFLAALSTYLSSLPPPRPPTSQPLLPVVLYLTDLALRLYYSDNAALYNQPQDPWYGCSIPVLKSSSSDPQVHQAVKDLLKSLHVSEEPRHAEAGAKLAADIVEACLGNAQREVEVGNGETDNAVLDKLPLGFSTGDVVVDRFAKVARVLQVRQLRELQDEINDAVARMQKVTANPKTDAKLGRVGR